MSDNNYPYLAPDGRYRFSIKTRIRKDSGLATPVSGATRIVAAEGASGTQDIYSIGSDSHLYHFERDADERWNAVRLPWRAMALAAVPQRDGTAKVFFVDPEDLVDAEDNVEKSVTVYELEHAGHEPQRRRLGRFSTTDAKVYGIAGLCGLQCRDGDNLLMTALAAHPVDETSNWVVFFGHGASTGALSLREGKGVVATRIKVANEDPGSSRWPHVTFALLYEDTLRLEWGSRNGALLQSDRVHIPELRGVIDFDILRDHSGKLVILALDHEHQLWALSQVAGGGSHPPRFTNAWLKLDCTQANGSRPALCRLEAVRTSTGDIEIFALDEDDRLFTLAEEATGSVDGWGRLRDLGIHAAHICVATGGDDHVEVFAVSRQNQLLWLRRDQRDNWRLEKIGWRAAVSAKAKLQVYQTGLTIQNDDAGAVAGVPVRITASRHLPASVNGLAYDLGPAEPIVAETNAYGRLHVTFELTCGCSVASLAFEADFLAGGHLDVRPDRKAQLLVCDTTRDEIFRPDSSRAKMQLIPEDTMIEQG